MSKESTFTLDVHGTYYIIAPGNIITGESLDYLINVLNSRTYYFALRKYYMGGGIEGELKTNRLLLLPVPFVYLNTSPTENEIQNNVFLNEEEKIYINNYKF